MNVRRTRSRRLLWGREAEADGEKEEGWVAEKNGPAPGRRLAAASTRGEPQPGGQSRRRTLSMGKDLQD